MQLRQEPGELRAVPVPVGRFNQLDCQDNLVGDAKLITALFPGSGGKKYALQA